MPEALGTARRCSLGLAVIVVVMVASTVCAQHAPVGQSPVQSSSPGPSLGNRQIPAQPGHTMTGTPPGLGHSMAIDGGGVAAGSEGGETITPGERDWRTRFNPLAPIVRGFRHDEAAASPPAAVAVPEADRTVASDSRPPAAVPVRPEIEVRGRYAQHWKEGGADVYLLRGGCQIQSGTESVSGHQLVIWRFPGDGTRVPVVAYLEGDVQVVRDGRRESLPASHLNMHVTACGIRAESIVELAAPPDDPVYRRAVGRRGDSSSSVAATPIQYSPPGRPPHFAPGQPAPGQSYGVEQYPVPGLASPGGGPMLAPGGDFSGGAVSPDMMGPEMPYVTPFAAPVPVAPQSTIRHVSIHPRTLGEGFSMQTMPSQNTVPPEYITTITGGVRIVVDGVPVDFNGQMVLATIDLSAERAVIWTDAERVNEFTTNFELDGSTPFEVYLEGNIVVRQGTTVVQAERAFYNLAEERGLLSETEVRGFIPELGTIVRLRAQELRQLSHDKYQAKNGWISTSDMGIPGWRIEASEIFLERRFTPSNSQYNPQTGQVEGGLMWFTSSHNKLYVENIPVGYFPYMSSPAEDPNVPLRSINIGYSSIFGAELKTQWDVASLFGLDLPPGTDWRFNVDYMSERGPAAGTRLRHRGAINFFGMQAQSLGEADLYYIHDSGTDQLGAGRMNLPLETPHRGRALLRHKLDLPFHTWVQTELGFLSDRNVREQYWENDWDSGKDYENLLQITHQYDNLTASIMGRGQLNDFDATTSWLPRGDVTLLGQNVGETPLLWSTHSSVGYARLNQAEAPDNPVADPFTPLPYFADLEGVVAMTRHELNLPMSFGPVNVTPYAMGEASYWQQDLTGDDLGRLYGSAGVRSSVMFSKYMPRVYSSILGLNGLAHKMVFDADYSYSQSTADLDRIAQYNEFDEDAQERFRTRFPTLEFGGLLPSIYDPRNYAVRSGAGRRVTSPWHELVDDQHVVRLGWRHRLQTRVGNPQRPRIYDWMTLDLEASLFPNADRDNYGETFGLLSANYAWNIGPSTSFLANSVVDVFDGGQRIWNAGILTSRSSRGSLYLGVRGIQAGPIDTALLIASASYQPTDKWIATVGTSYDIVEQMDRGQSFTVTRVGEYMMFIVGAGYDHSRETWSVNFSVQPRLGNVRFRSLNTSQLSSAGGGFGR